MAEKKKKPANRPQNVVSLPTRCLATGCNEKPKRLNFCKEHFQWFKEGLVTRAGTKAKDFDKKYQIFLKRQKKTA